METERRRRHCQISIHALREESDNIWAVVDTTSTYFNPRPPRGERLDIQQEIESYADISIHALREESDGSWHSQ